MNRLEELLENLQKKEEDRPKNTILWILAVIGAVTASCRHCLCSVPLLYSGLHGRLRRRF